MVKLLLVLGVCLFFAYKDTVVEEKRGLIVMNRTHVFGSKILGQL